MTEVKTIKPEVKPEERGGRHLDGAHGEGGASGRLAIFLNPGRGYLSIHIIIIL